MLLPSQQKTLDEILHDTKSGGLVLATSAAVLAQPAKLESLAAWASHASPAGKPVGGLPVPRLITPQQVQEHGTECANALVAAFAYQPNETQDLDADSAKQIVSDFMGFKASTDNVGSVLCLAAFVIGIVIRTAGWASDKETLSEYGKIVDDSATVTNSVLRADVAGALETCSSMILDWAGRIEAKRGDAGGYDAAQAAQFVLDHADEFGTLIGATIAQAAGALKWD